MEADTEAEWTSGWSPPPDERHGAMLMADPSPRRRCRPRVARRAPEHERGRKSQVERIVDGRDRLARGEDVVRGVDRADHPGPADHADDLVGACWGLSASTRNTSPLSVSRGADRAGSAGRADRGPARHRRPPAATGPPRAGGTKCPVRQARQDRGLRLARGAPLLAKSDGAAGQQSAGRHRGTHVRGSGVDASEPM